MNKDGSYLLNGGFIVSMFRKEISVGSKGTTLEYSGSDTVEEVINGTRPIDEDLRIYVSGHLT